MLGLPVVVGRFRHAVLPGQIGRLRASLDLLQKSYDLFLNEARSLHLPSFLKGVLLIELGAKSGLRVAASRALGYH